MTTCQTFPFKLHQGQNRKGTSYKGKKSNIKWNDGNKQNDIVVGTIKAGKQPHPQRVFKMTQKKKYNQTKQTQQKEQTGPHGYGG